MLVAEPWKNSPALFSIHPPARQHHNDRSAEKFLSVRRTIQCGQARGGGELHHDPGLASQAYLGRTDGFVGDRDQFAVRLSYLFQQP